MISNYIPRTDVSVYSSVSIGVGKVKFALEQTMKTHRTNTGIALLFL
jgi:hypothetical protein